MKPYLNTFLMKIKLLHPLNIQILSLFMMSAGWVYIFIILWNTWKGGDLKAEISAGIAPHTALEIILELADALYLVHSKGIIHGDIKPANIVFRSDDCPVLIDFGISKKIEISASQSRKAEKILASPGYASPEIMQGKKFNQKVDIYSLGVVLYEMLVGEKPYKGATPAEIVANSMRQPIPLLPDSLKALQPLINHMLTKDQKKRVGNARMISRFINTFEKSFKHK